MYTHRLALYMSNALKLAEATVEHVWQETPTVKGLRLKLQPPTSFSFKPGQWVDFYPPGLQAVGGYSICSSPSQLQHEGTVDLCVKSSSHPCAQWVHTQAAAATKVSVQAGGSFVLDPGSISRPCLFVAGGIGITALASMVLHLIEQQQAVPQVQPHIPYVLYSASAPNEFALLRRLLPLQQAGLLRLQLHTTQTHGMPAVLQTCGSSPPSQPEQSGTVKGPPHVRLPTMVEGRVQQQHLKTAVCQLQCTSLAGDKSAVAYVCGPPEMTDDMVHALHELRFNQNDVHVERWW